MKSVRLILLSVVFGLLLTEPLINVASHAVLVLGIPLLYLYVLTIWALLIGLLAYVIHRASAADDPLSDDD